jgi:holo-[acyl-carrier-protein] synthase
VIKGVGIDIFRSQRFTVSKFKKDIARQVLTDKELTRYRRTRRKDRPKYFSAIFAGKEALLKACGRGLRDGICWRSLDMEDIIGTTAGSWSRSRHDRGRPEAGVHVACGGTKEFAIAVAVLE